MQKNYLMHEKLVLASTAENESTDINVLNFSTALQGRIQDFGARVGVKDTWIRFPPARMSGTGPWGSGAEPQPLCNFCTFKVTKTAYSYHRKETRGIILESLRDITCK